MHFCYLRLGAVSHVYYQFSRGVAREGGQSPPPPEIGRSVNPIQTRGAYYTPHTIASPTPRIKKAIYTS